MTQEEKDLLLQDLCARLPYGVKVQLPYRSYQTPLKILSINPNGSAWVTGDKGYPFEIDWSNCKPYLFPLSSMTDEQIYKSPFGYATMDTIRQDDVWSAITIGGKECHHIIDWLNKNHFDYRGLIENGLAIDATDKNIY